MRLFEKLTKQGDEKMSRRTESTHLARRSVLKSYADGSKLVQIYDMDGKPRKTILLKTVLLSKNQSK